MDAIYVSVNSFKVLENRTGEFTTGRRVKMDCGLDGLKYASVVSSSYAAPYTTVVIDESDLTASLTSAWYGVTQPGVVGSLPDHVHAGEGQGGTIASTGVSEFIDLTDTPAIYSGSGGLYLRVDSTASGVDFSAVSGTDDHSHSAYSLTGHAHATYVPWDFGAGTISGTGDIYCNDIYTASGTVYIGDLQLTTDGQSLLVDGSPIEASAAVTTLSGLTDTPSTYDDGKYLRSTAIGTEWAAGSGGEVGSTTFSGLSDTPLDYGVDGQVVVSTGSSIGFSDYNINSVATDYTALELVAEYNLTAEILDATISGILGDTNDEWVVRSYFSAGGSPATLSVTFNGDTDYTQAYLGEGSDAFASNPSNPVNYIILGFAYADKSQASESVLHLKSGQNRVARTFNSRYDTADADLKNLTITEQWNNSVDEVSTFELSSNASITGYVRVYKRANISLPIYEPNYVDTALYANELVQEWNITNSGIDETFTWDGDVDDVVLFETINASIPPGSNVKLQFNNDVGSNYEKGYISQDGTAVMAGAGSPLTFFTLSNSNNLVESSQCVLFLKNTGNKRVILQDFGSQRSDDANNWWAAQIASFWDNTVDKITSFKLWTDNTDITGTFRLFKRTNIQLPVASGTGGGSSDVQTFLDLTDTPSTYSGTDGQYAVSTGSGIDFVDVGPSVVESNYKAYKLLQEYTFNGETVDVTLSGIQGDTDNILMIEVANCSFVGGTNDGLRVHLNGDTGANYEANYLRWDGSAADGGDKSGGTGTYMPAASGNRDSVGGKCEINLASGRRRTFTTSEGVYNSLAEDAALTNRAGWWSNTVDEVTSIRLVSDYTVTGTVRVYSFSKIYLPTEPAPPSEGNWVLVREINADNETFSESIPWDGNTWPRARIESVWSDSPPTIDDIKVRFNNDSANNYKNAYIAQSDAVVSAEDEQSRDHLRYVLGSFSGVRQLFAIADLHLATGAPRQFITRDSMSDSSSYGRMISHFGGHWTNTTSNIISIDIASTANATGQIKIYRWRDITDIPVDKGKQSLQVEYATTSGIYINPGDIHMKDSYYGMYDLDTRLEVSFDSLAISTWYYVYTDVSGSTASLDATNFTVSSGVPTVDYPSMGYYNGDARCVGYFRSNSSNEVEEWQSNGSKYTFLGVISLLGYGVYASGATMDVSVPFGNIPIHLKVRCGYTAGAGQSEIYLSNPDVAGTLHVGTAVEAKAPANIFATFVCSINKQLTLSAGFAGDASFISFNGPNYIYTGA